MVILALLEEACDILQLNPYETQTYKDYVSVTNPGTGLALMFRLANTRPVINEGYLLDSAGKIVSNSLDVEQIWLWVTADELPKDFRTDLMRYLCHRDELQEHLAELSQVRYERLRQWTNYHV
ncbi:hypothetical protein [Xanthomonas phage RTH11]|nr:hypothetical protein [Xanthomonas phage RTH11]